jgi:outer membrane protein OmpA-like peptidoglycan-associated protein
MRHCQCIRIIVLALIFSTIAGAHAPAIEFYITTPGRQSRLTVEPAADPQQVVVSVLDPAGEPIRGLGAADFTLGHGMRRGRIIAVEPLETRKDLPLNLVLVIDNSLSMRDRQAIQPLLAALEDLLRDIRPIDNVQAVVFSDKEKQWIGGRALNTQNFTSKDAAEWRRFFNDAFDRGLTKRTYLYEGVLAGLDLVRRMPAEERKVMVVFSDGEDLNSKISRKEAEAGALGISRFQAYCVDYMPEEKTDDFLAGLARDHNGRIWKARSAYELGPIFQAFKSTLLYKYALTYELLNPISLEPPALTFDLLNTTAGKPVGLKVFFAAAQSRIPDSYIRLADREQAEAFRPDGLSGSIERHWNVLNIVGHHLRKNPEARLGIVGCNSGAGTEADNLDLSQRRAEAVKSYLETIWGIDPARFLVEARGLPPEPSSPQAPGGRLENQRVEFIIDPEKVQSDAAGALIAETRGRGEAVVSLDLNPLPDARHWEILIQGEDRPLKVIEGSGAVPSRYRIPLDEMGRARLARLSSIEALIRVTDEKGAAHEATSDLCHIKTTQRELIHEIAFPPHGSVKLEPETVTVEEITVVDSAPLLNFVYFDTGRAEIPGRYSLFKTPAEARPFDEKGLRGTLEKYRNVLNVVGKRAAERPKARLKIVGCNSGAGEEKGRTELSRRRAETVAAYLQAVWGIEARRMEIEARGLPAVASAANLPEGRAENQRVEITSEDGTILDTVQSTYIEAVCETEQLRITPAIESGLPLKRWSIEIHGDGKRLDGLNGEGAPQPSYVLSLKEVGLMNIGGYRSLSAVIEAFDSKNQSFRAEDSSEVRLIRREERLAAREGYKVIEKYALILFDFNRADIKDRNKLVMDRIIGRIRDLPAARVRILGHTDTIGKTDYNVALSRKRARAAADLVSAGGIPEREKRVFHDGKGPTDPLFDNALPEGRAYNRTVTVTLEYEQRQ